VLTDVKLTFEGVKTRKYTRSAYRIFFCANLYFSTGVSPEAKPARGASPLARATILMKTSFAFDASLQLSIRQSTTLWARQRVEDLMDVARFQRRLQTRDSFDADRARHPLPARHALHFACCREEVVANTSARQVPADELPAGMQLDKVFGAPATGTADSFLKLWELRYSS